LESYSAGKEKRGGRRKPMTMLLRYEKKRIQVEMNKRTLRGSLESTVSICIAGYWSVQV